MVITDPEFLKGRDVVGVCQAAVLGGATMVQVRWKHGSPRELVTVTRALVQALSVPVLVNDRADVALVAGAAGAHLGQDDVPPSAIRPHAPAEFILGTSVGSPEEARAALDWPVNYWSIGPCYRTANKPDAGPPLGPEGFGRLARLSPPGMPVIGIGGIDAGNAAAIVEGGAVGVAVIGAVLGARDAAAAARGITTALERAIESRSAAP